MILQKFYPNAITMLWGTSPLRDIQSSICRPLLQALLDICANRSLQFQCQQYSRHNDSASSKCRFIQWRISNSYQHRWSYIIHEESMFHKQNLTLLIYTPTWYAIKLHHMIRRQCQCFILHTTPVIPLFSGRHSHTSEYQTIETLFRSHNMAGFALPNQTVQSGTTTQLN